MNLPFRYSRYRNPPAAWDHWLVLLVFLLTMYGLLMVTSASITVSGARYHQPFYFFWRQLSYLSLGVLGGVIILQFEINDWQKMSGPFMTVVMLLLALVLLPHVGHVVNGSARWIGMGFIRIEVSELAKLAVVIWLAAWLVRHPEEVSETPGGFFKPLGVLAVIAVLLLREPDFGATVVIMATALGMMFLAGVRVKYFLALLLGVSVLLGILAVAAPYRLARLTGFLNPWTNAFGSGYQLTQSLIAFGRGGWFGLGLGNGIQKLFYLPEAHTDFLFAVIGEELGLIGMLVLTILFVLLVIKIFLIGRRAQQLGMHFAGLLAYGIGFWIAIQFIVSIGVNCGILPTKGLTLPLVSYGGSSMLVNCAAIALLLRIDYENRTKT